MSDNTNRKMYFRRKKTLFKILRNLALIAFLTWSMFPILIIFASALKQPDQLFSYPPKIIGTPTLNNFVDLYKNWPAFFSGLRNSTEITIGSILLTLFISFPAAYSFSRLKNKVTYSSGLLLIIARIFPPIIITIPLYPLLQKIGLIDSKFVLVLLYSAFYVSIGSWILKSYLDNIPKEIEEAALLEGCGKIRTFFYIILPLSSPGIVSASILVCLFCWKEFLFAFLLTTSKAVTAPIILNEMLGSMFGVSWGPLFAATALQLLPILIIVWLFQKILIFGNSYGGEK